MNDFSYFETLLSERLRNLIWALIIITVLHIAFILLSIFNVTHPWRKNKKDRREKALYILVVFIFFSIFTVLFTVQAVQLKLDIKNESYETYFGEVEYNDYRMSKRRTSLFAADKSAGQKAVFCFLQLYHCNRNRQISF